MILLDRPTLRLQRSRHIGVARMPGDRIKIDITRQGGPWGNPYALNVHGSRDQVCDKHENWLRRQYELLNERWRLRGCDLVCVCRSYERCHGDLLVRVALMDRHELFDWMLAPPLEILMDL